MTDYHEPTEELEPRDRDIHRALTSLKEEIEAVDWYHQRVVRAADEELRSVLAHNRDEEIEHACMTLEWLRRNLPQWDRALSLYLFTTKNITEIEEEVEGAKEAGEGNPLSPRGSKAGDLGIGSLRETREERSR